MQNTIKNELKDTLYLGKEKKLEGKGLNGKQKVQKKKRQKTKGEKEKNKKDTLVELIGKTNKNFTN